MWIVRVALQRPYIFVVLAVLILLVSPVLISCVGASGFGGVDNYLQVITAQTATLANQRTEIDILRRRMDASVLLVKGLGGGWDVAQLPKP